MGFIFSGKRKHFQNVAMISLISTPMQSDRLTRRRLLTSYSNDMEAFLEEYTSYKHYYRRSYNPVKLKRLGFTPAVSTPTYTLDMLYTKQRLTDLGIEYQEIFGCYNSVYYPRLYVGLNYILNDLADDYILHYVNRTCIDNDGKEFSIVVETGSSPYTADDDVTKDERVDLNYVNLSLYPVDGSETITYTIYAPDRFIDKAYIEEDDNVYYDMSITKYKTVNIIEYTDNEGYLQFLLTEESMFAEIATEPIKYLPSYKVLPDNKDAPLTDDVKAVQKQALKGFGIEIDDIVKLVNNKKIDDFRLGITINIVPKNYATVKYLFNYFKQFRSTSMFNNTIHVYDTDTDQFTNTFTVSDAKGLAVKYQFDLSINTHVGTFPSTKKEWKVSVQSIISNDKLYNAEMLVSYNELYDEVTEGSTSDMYNVLKAEYNEGMPSNPSAEEVLRFSKVEEHFNKLPLDILSKVRRNVHHYVFCREEDIEEELKEYLIYTDRTDNDSEHVKAVVRYYKPTMSNYGNYGFTDTNDITVIKHTVDAVTGESETVLTRPAISLYKQVSENRYEEIVLSNVKITYDVGDRVAIREYNENNISTEYINFLGMESMFKNISYREFTYLYDSSLSGIAYSTESVYIHWYESEDFGLFIQFVMIVLSVYSGGVANLLLSTAKSIAISYAVSKLGAFIMKEVGGTMGAIITTVIVIGAMYSGKDISAALKTSGLWVKVASTLLQMETMATQIEMNELHEAYEENMKVINDKSEELRKLDEAIKEGNTLLPIDSLEPTYDTLDIIDTELYYNFDRRTTIPDDLFEVNDIMDKLTT